MLTDQSLVFPSSETGTTDHRPTKAERKKKKPNKKEVVSLQNIDEVVWLFTDLLVGESAGLGSTDTARPDELSH